MYIISLEDLEDQLPRVREPSVNDQHRREAVAVARGLWNWRTVNREQIDIDEKSL